MTAVLAERAQIVEQAVKAIRNDSSYTALMVEAARALEDRKERQKSKRSR